MTNQRVMPLSNEDKIISVFDKEEKDKLQAKEVNKLILNSLCSEIMDEVMDLGDAYPLDWKINPGNKSSSSPNDCKKSRSKSNKRGSK
jgi:hypothetical protein